MPARAARMQHSDACNGGMQAYGLRIGEQFCAQAETAHAFSLKSNRV